MRAWGVHHEMAPPLAWLLARTLHGIEAPVSIDAALATLAAGMGRDAELIHWQHLRGRHMQWHWLQPVFLQTSAASFS